MDTMGAYQFKSTRVFRQIPLLDATSLVARDKFALVGMNADVVDYNRIK